MQVSVLPENYSFVSVVADNTETYFIWNDGNVDRISRRTAIGLLRYDKKGYENFLYPVYMDEEGRFQTMLLDDGRWSGKPYDSFTVGIPKILGSVYRITEVDKPEDILPLIRTLKTEYGISFRKPSGKTIAINMRVGKNSFYMDNVDENDNDLPFGNNYGIWDKSYVLNDPESLIAIGKWLGLFRYIFDIPELRYDLRFDSTEGYTPGEWQDDMVDNGYPPYEEQRSIDAESESTYKASWEQAIHAEADRFYGFYSSIMGKK